MEITDKNYKNIVFKSEKPVLVDFSASWCGPCRLVSPIVDEIEKEYQDKAVIGKVDVDTNPEMTAEFGIRNIPAILYFKNGKIVDKQVGAAAKGILENKLKALL